MFGRDEGGRKGSVLIWTVKTTAAVGCLSYLASSWLAGPATDGGTVSRLASVISRGTDDPVTTGSIIRGAGSAKLDPCIAPRRP